MSTELMIYGKVLDPLAFMRESGTVIAKSKMFGCETIEQGQTLALISMTEGLPFLELRRRYHIVGGDLTMRADFMRAELRRLGGDYDWIKDGDDGIEARMWIEFRDRRHEVSYTIEDAKKEGLVRKKSRWEKDPGSMLRARCSTKAVRMYASEVMAGFCTDEEMNAIHEGNGTNGTNGKPTATQDDAIDASFTVVEEPAAAEPEATSEPVAATVEPADGTASSDQREQIKKLWGVLGVSPADREKQLAKRNCNSIRSLTSDQANELIGKLDAVLAKREAAEREPVEPATEREPGDDPDEDGDAPCSPEQAAALKEQLKQANQKVPGIVGKFKDTMGIANVGKIDELTSSEVDSLLALLTGNELETFLGESLWKPAKREEVPF